MPTIISLASIIQMPSSISISNTQWPLVTQTLGALYLRYKWHVSVI